MFSPSKTRWGVLILAGLVLFYGPACRRKYKLPPPSYTLTSDQLFKEFKDEKTATDKYLGKTLEITGIVEKVGKDSSGEPYIAFKGEENLGDVQCFFPRPQSEEILKVPAWLNVTLRGKCLSKVVHVTLDNCELVKK